ncbi:hypothetical protein JQM64_10830 [Fournierella massiliensis]|nr:hypothetical protein [Fournierella massiliensis]MCF2558003.1 hypothetical protein [Fournierella massiliensis]
MKTKFWPAFRWQTREYGLGVATFWAVMALLELAFLTVSMVALDRGVQIEESSFNGLGVMAWFCYFVLGLAQVRADLRLGAQFGVTRRTMLGATWLAVATTGAGLALALEVLTALGQGIMRDSGAHVLDMYQVLYLQDSWLVLSPVQHLASAVFNLCGMLGAFGAGAALSLVLWHCARVRWVVLICLALPALMGGLISLGVWLRVDPSPFFAWMLASPLNGGFFFLAAGALTGLAGWLALRRLNIRPGAI